MPTGRPADGKRQLHHDAPGLADARHLNRTERTQWHTHYRVDAGGRQAGFVRAFGGAWVRAHGGISMPVEGARVNPGKAVDDS